MIFKIDQVRRDGMILTAVGRIEKCDAMSKIPPSKRKTARASLWAIAQGLGLPKPAPKTNRR
jgi:hypothetical protein